MPGFAMSAAAKSLVVFAMYLFVLGLALIIVPNAILALFGLPPTSDVWIRIIGVVALNLRTIRSDPRAPASYSSFAGQCMAG